MTTVGPGRKWAFSLARTDRLRTHVGIGDASGWCDSYSGALLTPLPLHSPPPPSPRSAAAEEFPDEVAAAEALYAAAAAESDEEEEDAPAPVDEIPFGTQCGE